MILFLFVANFSFAQSVTATITRTNVMTNNNSTSASQGTSLLCNNNTMTLTANPVVTGFCGGYSTSYQWSYSYNSNGSNRTNLNTNQTETFVYSNPGVSLPYYVFCLVTVSGNIGSGCSTSYTDDVEVSTSFTYTANQTNNQIVKLSKNPICLGESVDLELKSDVGTLFWDFSSNGSGGSVSAITGNGISNAQSYWFVNGVQPTTSGAIEYKGIGKTINGCPIQKTVILTVNPLPNIDITVNKNPLCIGETLALSASGANSYIWTSSLDGGLQTTSGSNVTAIPSSSGNKTYTVTGTSSSTSCQNSKSTNIVVLDIPNPVFSVSYNQRTITLTNTTSTYFGPGVLEYIWDYGDGSPLYYTISNANHSHTYTNAQQYTITLRTRVNPGNCIRQNSQLITIDATPISNFNMPSVVCLKSDGNGTTYNDVSFTNLTTSNPTGKENTFVYNWNFGDGTSLNNQTYSSVINHSYSSTGFYTVTLSVTNSTGRETVNIVKYISVNTNPIFSGFSDYITTTGNCQNRDIEFKMGSFSSVSHSGFPLTWSMDYDGNNTNGGNFDGFDVVYSANTGNSFSQLQQSSNFTSINSGTITIRGQLKSTNDGCKTTYEEQFTIHPTPSASIVFSPNKNSMCKNEANPVVISSSNISSGNSYDWEYTPPASNTYYRTTSSFSPLSTMLVVGQADIKLKVSNSFGCWSDQATSAFNIWDIPKPNFTNDIVCAGNVTTFTNTTANPQNTYLWEFNDNANSTSTAQNPSTVFDAANSYNVKLTVTENTNNCSDFISKTVTVKPNPVTDFSLSNIKCENQEITFTDNSTISGSNTITNREWDWTNDNIYDVSSVNLTQNYLYTASGTYTAKLRATASNGCQSTTTKQITINSKPSKPNFTINANSQGNTNFICYGENYSLSVVNPINNFTYNWAFNDNLTNNTNTTYNGTGVAPMPNVRPYSVRATDGNGCFNTSDVQNLVIRQVLTNLIISSGNNVLCQGATATLTGPQNTPTQTYQWLKADYDPNNLTFSSTYNAVGGTSRNHIVDNSNQGRYKYIASLAIPNSSNLCSAESDVAIDIINALPLALSHTGVNDLDLINPQILNHINNTFPVYTQFNWYRNGILESNAAGFLVTKPGKYYLVALGSCGFEKSNEVEFKYNCTDIGYNLSYLGNQTFSSPTTITSSNPIKLSGNWVINNGANVVLNNVKIIAENCGRITVENGSLTINNSIMTGCEDWTGIISNSSSSTISINGTVVSKAKIGAMSNNGGILNINNSTFDDNNTHVVYGFRTLPNSSSINQSKFGELNYNSNSCTHPYETSLNMDNSPMVYFQEVNGITMFGNEFSTFNTDPNNIIDAIQGKNVSSLNISNNEDNGFLDHGININDGNLLNINNNTFNFKVLPPSLALYNTRGPWTNTGIKLNFVRGSTIERNLISNADEGITFYQNTTSTLTTTNITKNRMEYCTYGLVSATHENPALSSPPYQNFAARTIYVQVTCNSFNFNDYGWIGTGAYPTQGSSAQATGNSFLNNNIFNVGVATTNQYFYISSEDPYGVPNYPLVLDGVTHNSNTTLFNPISTSNSGACSNKRNMDSYTEEIENSDNFVDVKDININTYPNPFSHYFEVSSYNADNSKFYKIVVYDMLGKVVFEQNDDFTNKVFVSTENWAQGLYVVKVIGSNGDLLMSEKIIKH